MFANSLSFMDAFIITSIFIRLIRNVWDSVIPQVVTTTILCSVRTFIILIFSTKIHQKAHLFIRVMNTIFRINLQNSSSYLCMAHDHGYQHSLCNLHHLTHISPHWMHILPCHYHSNMNYEQHKFPFNSSYLQNEQT